MAGLPDLSNRIKTLFKRWLRLVKLSLGLSMLLHLALFMVLSGVYFLKRATMPIRIIQVKLLEENQIGEQLTDDEGQQEQEQEQDESPVPEPQTAGTEADLAPVALPDKSQIPDPEQAVIALAQAVVDHSGLGARTGDAKSHALGRYGGTSASESAVAAGLAWLAAHQDPDGKWSCRAFDQRCPLHDKCTGVGRKENAVFDTGVTGLSLLAFLGAGYTHQTGAYKEVVSKGLQYLLRVQLPDGAFSRKNAAGQMYHQGINTLVLAECFRMTNDPSLRVPIEKAAAFIISTQQSSGGWDYTQLDTGRNDMSITGWQVMALRSVEDAGIEVPAGVMLHCRSFLREMTDKEGQVRYSTKGPLQLRRGSGMVSVGLLCRLYTGFDFKEEAVRQGMDILLDNRPLWPDLKSGNRLNSMYYWYYATLVMFHVGGDPWRTWNEALQSELLLHQDATGHQHGSWPPDGQWGWYGGRVYATAINILSLEVYYRYLPMYEQPPPLARFVKLLEKGMESPDKKTRLLAVKEIAALPDGIAIPFLMRMATDYEGYVRLNAAIGLFERGNELAMPVFAKCLEDTNAFIRSKVLEILSAQGDPENIPLFITALADKKDFIRRRANQYLVAATGKSFGFEKQHMIAPAEAHNTWHTWWLIHGEP